MERMDDASDIVWQDIIPDHLLLEIFSYLGKADLGIASKVCWQWNRVAQDEVLWHCLAVEKWGIKGKDKLEASWKEEMKRLDWQVPCECTETIHRHTDEVLDLWALDQPCKVLDEHNMKTQFDWDLCQLSLFNSNDSRLLVCGSVSVLEDDGIRQDANTKGLGAVFTLKSKENAGTELICTHFIPLEPPTLFGHWLTDNLVVGGLPYQGLGDLSFITVYNVDGDVDVKEDPTWPAGENLFRFTGNRYHLMNLLIANVPTNVDKSKFFCDACANAFHRNGRTRHESNGSHNSDGMGSESDSSCDNCSNSKFMDRKTDDDRSFINPEFERQCSRKRQCIDYDEQGSLVGNGEHTCTNTTQADIMLHLKTPKVKHYVSFVTGLHDTIHLYEVDQHEIQRLQRVIDSESLCDLRIPRYSFAFEDTYITGISLAKDHSVLFVNYRERLLRPGHEDEEDFERVFCEEIKIRCIDLQKMAVMEGVVFQGHVGFSYFPAWYICLDASRDYVASCSEDNSVYIWDWRHQFRIAHLLHGEPTPNPYDSPFGHTTVTNGVAFSPVDQETCISVCDSKMIKVWRSKHRIRSLARKQSPWAETGSRYS
ncbi:F-box/WD repeat-containing protein 5-like isoform X2 [Mya arenaria]|uniref:F-box/WD repeat-containing protein 5-like isoform X2 n=1 Tax=Mya arenaria TaxID=6604 RepID=UPI0022E45FD2|nr:F-box/WD repeat-containing protein 5-like isoform X2 [Mya arenaria]